jgi:hypothetical protein
MFFSFMLGALVMLVFGVFAPNTFTKMTGMVRSLWDKVKEEEQTDDFSGK